MSQKHVCWKEKPRVCPQIKFQFLDQLDHKVGFIKFDQSEQINFVQKMICNLRLVLGTQPMFLIMMIHFPVQSSKFG